MPRGERPLDNGPLREFAEGLRRLRVEVGSPTYRELSLRARYSPSVLSDAAGGRKLPSLAVTLAYVTACDGDAAEWEARWRALTEPVGTKEGPCPYVGLAAFQADDAGLFFGRERLIRRVLALIRDRRFVGVFGASGAGKSSLLRAGVATSSEWTSTVVVPGPHPFDELAARFSTTVGELAAHPSNLSMVLRQHGVELLVVDQFEEVFTLCGDTERSRFVAALMHPALRVVIGVRADFYGHCGQHPDLVTALDGGQVLVGPMSTDELRRAVIRPAAVANCVVEEALVTRLVADVGNQVGALPLLSHALRETWHRRQGISLTLTSYEKTGGLQHALAQSAEQTFTALTPAQQDRARQLFLRLVALGDGTEDTRRRVPATELDDDPDLAAAIERLTAARLVTHDRCGVQITHEALIRHWPRLAGWLADDRDGLRVHRQLTEAADVWISLDRDDEALYVGNRLARTQEWADDHSAALSGRERDFLRASQSLERATLAADRRATRRLRVLAVSLAALFLLAAGTATVAVNAEVTQQATQKQRNDAVLDGVAAKIPSLLEHHQTSLAIQLAGALYEMSPSEWSYSLLIQSLGLSSTITATDGPSSFAADMRRLATGESDGVVKVWDTSLPYLPKQTASLPHGGTAVSSVAISPEGSLLAASYDDGTVQLWSLSDAGVPTPLTSFAPGYSRLLFGRDDKTLAMTDATDVLRLVDLTNPRAPEIGAPISGITGPVAFGPDGSIFGFPPGPARHGSDPYQLRRLDGDTVIEVAGVEPGSKSPVVVSPDGRTIATPSLAKGVDLWRLPAKASAFRSYTLRNDTGTVTAFSADGSMIAVVSRDGTVGLSRIGSGDHDVNSVAGVSAGQLDVRALGFAADGDLYVSTATGLHVWPTNPAQIRVQQCKVGKMLLEDWNRYFPGFEYRSPC